MNFVDRLFPSINACLISVLTFPSLLTRNDQVVTDFKLWVKKSTNIIDKNLTLLIKSFLNKAKKNIDVIMPGFTHLKNAQPVLFSHYLLAYVEMFKRDKKRIKNFLENINENPLGSAALAGTSYNIDRNFTSKKLGFKKPTDNSIDSVSDRDFAIEFLFIASLCINGALLLFKAKKILCFQFIWRRK